MKLTLKEEERLIIFNIAEIARRRWCSGLKLNYVEADALICDELLERGRAGMNTLAELIELGSQIITKEDVMEDIMKKIDFYLKKRAAGRLQIECIVYSNTYGLLGMTAKAEELLRRLL